MNPMNNGEDVYNFFQWYRYTLLNSNVHFLFLPSFTYPFWYVTTFQRAIIFSDKMILFFEWNNQGNKMRHLFIQSFLHQCIVVICGNSHYIPSSSIRYLIHDFVHTLGSSLWNFSMWNYARPDRTVSWISISILE